MVKPIIAGPFGGDVGVEWDDGSYTGIRQLILRSGLIIDGIKIEYDDNGCPKWSELHGGTGGSSHEIKLDYPDEYLTSISGHYSTYVDRFILFSLKIHTNKRKIGPFGTQKGKCFTISSNFGKIIGFFGKHSPYLVSIGAYLEPIHPIKSVGPFGGEGGVPWDDGKYTGIRRLIVDSGSVINSILIEYDDDGTSVWSLRHGAISDGGNTVSVEIDYPDEFVTSISGSYRANLSPVVVQSLTIHTNRRACGPFGAEKGKCFSFPSTEGKIIGLHGKCGTYLDAIGAHFEPTSNLYMVKTLGPFGGERGDAWDDGIHTAIKKIRLVHGSFVGAICIEYYDDGESSIWYPLHGGKHEPKTDTIILDFPDEFLTSISGYYTVDDLNGNMIASLKFHSNRRTYGPYGSEFGKFFSVPSFDGKIIGFHGKCSNYLFSIGAHMELISNPKPSEFVKPVGGQGGDLWDDGIYTTVRQLIVTCGSVVNSIRIEYDKDGHSVRSSKHGKSDGDNLYTIKLDHPQEFLVSLSGFYSSDSSSAIIQSLSIQSNKKTYGPFGAGKGKHEFSLSSVYGKIIGFHGTSGDYLHSIGVHVKPIPMPYKYKYLEACGGQGGQLWDDGIHTTIRQLIIGAGSVIDSIQTEYDMHGRSAWSRRRGGNGGNKYMVKLDYPSEFLVSISGYYATGSISTIQSLTIQSNRRIYGPFGTRRGMTFSIRSPGCKIIGLHGTAYGCLCAIGVYMEEIES